MADIIPFKSKNQKYDSNIAPFTLLHLNQAVVTNPELADFEIIVQMPGGEFMYVSDAKAYKQDEIIVLQVEPYN